MKVLIVNPILYTSETRDIKKVESIKDTMIYDLCLGFKECGYDITLAAAEDYKPSVDEEYPFDIIWMETKLKKLCIPNALPYCPDIKSIAKNGGFDLIISSEVFSLNTLNLCLHSKKNLIVWHELAKHNKMMHSIPSKIWYGIIARLFFRNVLIVPRSVEARDFISHFCNRVSDIIIDHGVNLNKFTLETNKSNYFVVSSQLISRKRIDKIINAFNKYLAKYDSTAKLYIMGDGDERNNLETLTDRLGINDSVVFTGKMPHSQLIKKLKGASAMLVYTEKDNNMVSIVESIAVGTPVITTSVPYNAGYIKAEGLGIVDDNWNEDTLNEIKSNKQYIENCTQYRNKLSTESKAKIFAELSKKL